METKKMTADIAIIGAGIIGCALARELSRYGARVVVVEKEADLGWGTTKANSGILHAGYAGERGSLKLKLCPRGNKLFRKYAQELDIELKNIGSLVHARNKQQQENLQTLYRQGRENGVEHLAVIEGNANIRKLEPRIAAQVCASLFAQDACIVSPYGAAIALYENARANGIFFLFDFEVSRIEQGDNFLLFSDDAVLEARYVVNAAGLYAHRIAQMIGDCSLSMNGIRGEYLLLDRAAAGYVQKINFPVTEGSKKKSKGILITPTVGDNILLGPTYVPSSTEDVSTSKDGLREIKAKAKSYFDQIPFGQVITSFAGIRAVSDSNDFIISHSEINARFIHIGGIQSPGLTCAFSISEMAIGLLKEAGARLEANRHFKPYRKSIMKLDQQDYMANTSLWSENQNYGRIVCRCEKITEAEIVEAVARGAKTLDGVKFRTRAQMGRCQGGYCSLRIMHILARELKIPLEAVTKNGKRSSLATGRVQ